MSATNAVETDILALLFNATTWANIAQNTGSSPISAFWISLHTADPGETGNQATNETTYTGYARLTLDRNTGGWTVADGSAVNVTTLTFGKCTAAPGNPITHVGLGTNQTGTGRLLLSNPLTSPLTMAAGVTALFEAGSLEFTCD